MARDVSDTNPITDRSELVAWLDAGSKPQEAFRIGTEHEKFAFYQSDLSPVPYLGRPDRGLGGIGALLQGLQSLNGWNPIMDGDALIGLYDDHGGAISIEPGGQFELSGAPLETIHETAAELSEHIAQCHQVAAQHDIGFLSLGMTPDWTLDRVPVMPKSRYKIMTAYMPKVGTRGLDMMYRTCTAQVNLDFSSEADMVKKLRVSVALQPLATALFANSPFKDGVPSGRLSERSEIWRDTDNHRAGMLPFIFEDGMSFERYVDYALDVPMYFIKRGDHYHDVAGANFRDLLAGNLAQMPGEKAVLSDWANHLSTIFPEVRLKRYLEMRGADVGGPEQILAVSAFFTGLLYDQSVLDAAWDIVKGWSAQDRQTLRDDVPRLGLRAQIAGRPLKDIALQVLALTKAGLARRKKLNASGADEGIYLEALEARVADARCPADDLLDAFHGRWQKSVAPAYKEYVF